MGKINRWAEAVRDYEVLRKILPDDKEVAEALFHANIALKTSRGEEVSNVKFGGEVEDVTGLEQFQAEISLSELAWHVYGCVRESDDLAVCRQGSNKVDSPGLAYLTVWNMKTWKAMVEKALHDMRVEAAETKLAHERKVLEAHEMMKNAQRKLEEAEAKRQSAKSLHAEASRFRSSALINSQDIEAREDDLRRQISFQAECDAKEKELSLQRQSLYDSRKILHQEQERLLEGKNLLNQRENYIYEKTKELSRFEKELNEEKAKYEEECRCLTERRSRSDLDIASLTNREEVLLHNVKGVEEAEVLKGFVNEELRTLHLFSMRILLLLKWANS